MFKDQNLAEKWIFSKKSCFCRAQEGPAYTWLFIRSDRASKQATKQASLVRLQRSNFGLYTFIKGQRDKGATQEHRNKGTTQEQRNKGTEEQRKKGTQEKTNKGTKELGYLVTW